MAHVSCTHLHAYGWRLTRGGRSALQWARTTLGNTDDRMHVGTRHVDIFACYRL